MKRTIPAVLTHLGLLSLLLLPLCASASTEGFRERYSSDVDGQTWMLHIDSGRSFPSMISAKLQMGDALNRYILLGSVNGTVDDDVAITGGELHDGDVLKFGDAEVQFVQGDSA